MEPKITREVSVVSGSRRVVLKDMNANDYYSDTDKAFGRGSRSAPEVAAECKKRIESGKYDVIILNFANCDMVGHTGVFEAAVKAVEAVDAAVKEVVTAVLDAGGCAFLTADHGNAEKMKNPDGTPFTAHTTNVVPFVAIGCGDVKLREGGCLADIAPTMLPYIGLPVPAEMSGKSIIVE